MNLDSRQKKISFLKRLAEGKAKIAEVLPPVCEIWKAYHDDQNTFINEKDGLIITKDQLEERQRTAGDNIIFVEVKYRRKEINHNPKNEQI
jgi:hypothetical protein